MLKPSATLQDKVNYTLARYGTSKDFGETFSISNLNRFTLYPDRCCLGTAPSLYTMKAAYGDAYPIQWLMGMIISFSEYSGCKKKVSPFQAERLAYNIFSEYNFLKPTEIMLFFHQLECGYYGQVDWGTFDPIRIFSKIGLFLEYRHNVYAREDSRLQEIQMAEDRKNAVPPPPEIAARLNAYFARIASTSNRASTQCSAPRIQGAAQQPTLPPPDLPEQQNIETI